MRNLTETERREVTSLTAEHFGQEDIVEALMHKFLSSDDVSISRETRVTVGGYLRLKRHLREQVKNVVYDLKG